ncbi:hypothetical protein Q8F55_004766 [Vanrija albida]|uniref:THH1/TOM1/TOM3 domain-containing protein n=1 Tax=Vanrija albida TaxID=181172 RepID=A0ABR3PZV4_9TREE
MSSIASTVTSAAAAATSRLPPPPPSAIDTPTPGYIVLLRAIADGQRAAPNSHGGQRINIVISVVYALVGVCLAVRLYHRSRRSVYALLVSAAFLRMITFALRAPIHNVAGGQGGNWAALLKVSSALLYVVWAIVAEAMTRFLLHWYEHLRGPVSGLPRAAVSTRFLLVPLAMALNIAGYTLLVQGLHNSDPSRDFGKVDTGTSLAKAGGALYIVFAAVFLGAAVWVHFVKHNREPGHEQEPDYCPSRTSATGLALLLAASLTTSAAYFLWIACLSWVDPALSTDGVAIAPYKTLSSFANNASCLDLMTVLPELLSFACFFVLNVEDGDARFGLTGTAAVSRCDYSLGRRQPDMLQAGSGYIEPGDRRHRHEDDVI